jgi:hypothetical protein
MLVWCKSRLKGGCTVKIGCPTRGSTRNGNGRRFPTTDIRQPHPSGMSLPVNPPDGRSIAPYRWVMKPFLALDPFRQDLIYAARSLRKSPGLVATVAISLGLGIGVNTTVFNLFNITVLAKPTAVEPDRLVTIEPGNGNRISYPNYKDLGASSAFAGMAVTTMGTVNLRDQNRVENVLALET